MQNDFHFIHVLAVLKLQISDHTKLSLSPTLCHRMFSLISVIDEFSKVLIVLCFVALSVFVCLFLLVPKQILSSASGSLEKQFQALDA